MDVPADGGSYTKLKGRRECYEDQMGARRETDAT